jgi:hypothetical protein
VGIVVEEREARLVKEHQNDPSEYQKMPLHWLSKIVTPALAL